MNWSLFAKGSGVVSLLQLGLWGYEEKYQDATCVDIGWVFGVSFLSLLGAIKGNGDMSRRLLAGLLPSLWGGRLLYHLIPDRLLSQPHKEDPRYSSLRDKWGNNSSWKFFFFFQGQVLASAFFAYPMMLASFTKSPISTPSALISIGIASTAIAGEMLSDYQLKQFKSKPENKGKVMQEGLWRYSRHPNYFFEWLHWSAYPFLCFGSPIPWYTTLAQPIGMFFLIFKVTGIPPLEERMLSSKGNEYREYQKRTSVFFPWFPKY